MRITIGRQLAVGFGVVIASMLISATVAYFKIRQMNQHMAEMVDEAFPAAAVCDDLRSGLIHSLASLRGYVVLGADVDEAEQFKSQRKTAWTDIDTGLKNLGELAGVWTDSQDKQYLKQIPTSFVQLRKVQQDVENVAHADENIAAYHLLLTEATPLVDQMDAALAAIIKEEGLLAATSHRKELLRIMSELQGSLGASLASLRVYLISGDETFKQGFQQHWQSYHAANREGLDVLGRMTQTQRRQWDRFDELRAQFAPLPLKMIELREAEDWNKANHLLREQAIPLADGILLALERLKTSAARRVERGREDLAAVSVAVTTTLTVATLLAALLGCLLAVVIGRRVVGAINNAIDVVASMATQMSTTANQQEQMAHQQAAAVNEVTATMAHLTRSSELSAQQAEQSLEGAKRVLGLAEDGTLTVRQTMEGMASLNEKINAVGKHIVQLSEQTSQISDVTELVSGLANQTHVLGLNAAVEAAHAGEQGAGFAVVASQIRKLADESASALDRIGTLVKQIQTATNSTVMVTEEGTKTLEAGNKFTEKTSDAFQDVKESIDLAVGGIQQISLNVSEQAHAISDVGDAMEEINRGAREYERQTSNTKQIINKLTDAVRQLQEVV